ncbi:MAG: rhomboid family intramembrane serine protease [Verrucomicrobiae bacterium]|nr:rhomboid family intramembrane serine protease [Verrucomicrobiae bacterium]
MARHRLEELHRTRPTQSVPEESWMWVPAIFGFPVESETEPLRRYPWVTWGLAFTILLVSALAFTDLETAVGRWGFVPSEAFRWGGLTILTSFFLHGGIWHLIGNLYFLLIFGDNVEDYVGRWRFGALILGATVAGALVHLLFDPGSRVPAVGASGGLSGILLFYALRFPHARLGFLFRFSLYFRWIEISAWGALVLWLMLQLIFLGIQWTGAGEVAATAHLGGALAGWGFWHWWRHHDCLKQP